MITYAGPTLDCFLPTHQNFIPFQGFFSCWVCVSYDKTSELRNNSSFSGRFSDFGVHKNHLGSMFNMQIPSLTPPQQESRSRWSPGICILTRFSGNSDASGPGSSTGKLKPTEGKARSNPAAQTTYSSGLWSGSNEIIDGRALWKVFSTINTRRHYYFPAGTSLWQKWLGTFSLNYHNHLFEDPTKPITLNSPGME